MAYSSGDDVALSSYKTGNASATMESKQLTFMNLVKTHKILLTKSQIPKIKAEKQVALSKMITEYKQSTGSVLTEKQVMKKINNMKNDVKICILGRSIAT